MLCDWFRTPGIETYLRCVSTTPIQEGQDRKILRVAVVTRRLFLPSPRYRWDNTELTEFFYEHANQKKVTRVTQQLSDLHQMVSAPTVDEVVKAYESLLQAQPGVTPPIVEKLLGSRSDLPKKQMQASEARPI